MPSTQDEWGHKEPFESVGGSTPLRNQVQEQDHPMTLLAAVGKPSSPANAFSFEHVEHVSFYLSPPPPVYKHAYKCLIGDLIYLGTCGFIYLEISR